MIGMAAWALALFQIPFIINFFWSIWKGEKVERQSVGGDDARVGGARRRRRTATS